MEKMSILLVFFLFFLLQTNVPLRQSLLSIWAASFMRTFADRAEPTCSSLFEHSERADGIVWPISPPKTAV